MARKDDAVNNLMKKNKALKNAMEPRRAYNLRKTSASMSNQVFSPDRYPRNQFSLTSTTNNNPFMNTKSHLQS
eukprot:CAMPEP_0116871904 /NCGR_PEP_ID=MMETSP0463-20121206/2461_1 /TAXON_ID=181622 /ORGANISM="Strombidinopsis sp, Strain SopsisLIS2011" /LENGTH=72 /DNA_ID=CAMNT_0004511205 /DNA_START=837 /DNA_END=1055 /DNA_ORIENTATION=-